MDSDGDVEVRSFMQVSAFALTFQISTYLRKTHAAEHAELLRKQQENAARLAREEATRAETKKLEKQAEVERKRKRREKEHKRWADARELYEARWKELLAPATAEGPEKPLKFMDIPWPLFFQDLFVDGKSKNGYHFDLEAITPDAITTFLLPPERFSDHSTDAVLKKERREKLREAMLRFHPDKFEGRVLSRVEERDREKTQEAVAKIAVVLNSLMATGQSVLTYCSTFTNKIRSSVVLSELN